MPLLTLLPLRFSTVVPACDCKLRAAKLCSSVFLCFTVQDWRDCIHRWIKEVHSPDRLNLTVFMDHRMPQYWCIDHQPLQCLEKLDDFYQLPATHSTVCKHSHKIKGVIHSHRDWHIHAFSSAFLRNYTFSLFPKAKVLKLKPVQVALTPTTLTIIIILTWSFIFISASPKVVSPNFNYST